MTASVSPNPLNPQAVLTLWLARPGPVTVKLFDVRGGLVRTLLNESMMSAGYRDVRIDGRNDRGVPLGSGVYFYRVESEGEIVSGRLAIMR